MTKRYGDVTVLDHIDLEIQAGEFMTLLGPSGSGKTTTLNLIAGFTDLSEGEIFIHGNPVAKLPANKRDIGVVFQNYSLFPHMTVADNIAYPLRRRRVAAPERKERVAKALEMVRLADYGSRLPAELSGGQQQRVALARALVYGPRVLLMDEPLGALDKKLREWLQLEIKRIHSEVGSTFVFVTHDQEEALQLSDRIAVFNGGRIEQVGTGVELYERPASLFVGNFIGESTVVHGTHERTSDGGTAIVGDGYRVVVPGQVSSAQQVILIRPESLSLLPRTSTVDSRSSNVVPVDVLSATYLGAEWRYEVSQPDGRRGIVRSPRTARPYSAGASCWMKWAPEHGVLLDGAQDVESPA